MRAFYIILCVVCRRRRRRRRRRRLLQLLLQFHYIKAQRAQKHLSLPSIVRTPRINNNSSKNITTKSHAWSVATSRSLRSRPILRPVQLRSRSFVRPSQHPLNCPACRPEGTETLSLPRHSRSDGSRRPEGAGSSATSLSSFISFELAGSRVQCRSPYLDPLLVFAALNVARVRCLEEPP